MISGQQIIGIGLQNEAAGSDSLYLAFNKTKDNFATLFACASPYTTFTGTGVSVITDPGSGAVAFTNTGVTSLIEGTGIVLSGSNGNITISSTGGGGGGGGTVTSVGVQPISLSRLWVGGDNPITASGIIHIDLANSGVTGGTYTYPTITVDQYGRITHITTASSVGTVTSVVVTPGTGIQVTGSPYTSTGNINIVNTGVTRLNAGTGIALSGSNGNITVSSTITQNPGTVTSVGLTSTSLVVTPTPITTNGILSVELPSPLILSGVVGSTSEEIFDGGVASVSITTTHFAGITLGGDVGTLPDGTHGQIKILIQTLADAMWTIMVDHSGWGLGPAGELGAIHFPNVCSSCTLQFLNGKWYPTGINDVGFTGD